MIFFLYRSDIERELDAYCQYKMTIMQSSHLMLQTFHSVMCRQLSLPTNLYSVHTQRKAHIDVPLLSWSADSAKQGQWLIITNNELPYVYVFCFLYTVDCCFVFDDVRTMLTGFISSSIHIGFLFSVQDFQLTIVMAGRDNELSI